jgi:hypothetical protein
MDDQVFEVVYGSSSMDGAPRAASMKVLRARPSIRRW